MIYTVTLNPALDKTVVVEGLKVDAVNRATEVRQDPGGKGVNVSKTIQALGGESVAFAILGGSTGSFISESLDRMGIACRSFPVMGETRTNTKVVDPVGDTFTDINEPGAPVTEELLAQALDALTQELVPGDAVVLSGSLPAGAPVDTYATWTRACKKRGAAVYLDADGVYLKEGIAAGPDLIKPNDVELARMLDRELADDAAIVDAARELIAQGVGAVMVSMGGEGALYVGEDRAVRLRQPKVEVLSTVGAGDSVVAALVYGFSQGLALEETLALSMATGAATVTQPGTVPARREDIDRLLDQIAIEEL